MSSVFTFLQEVNEGLCTLALQAEADVWSNPRATLIQGRLFSEEMATTVSKTEKVEPMYSIKSNERIQLLARRDIISEELKESFEWLRRNGNMAAHDVKPVPPDLALTAHRQIFTLALWFVESYGSLDIELPTYAMPTMPTSGDHEQSVTKLDVSEQLEQLVSAQLEAKILPTLKEQFKHLHDKITQVAGIGTTVSQSVITGAVDVGDYLTGQGLTTIDKRPNGGALWVVGGWELKDVLFALKSYEIHFKFAKNGSQSTKRKPAWFVLGNATIPIATQEKVSSTPVGPDMEEEVGAQLRKSFRNKELIFPASMIDLGLDDIEISGCTSLVQYLKEECNVTTIQELPEDLTTMTEKINGVGPKTIDRFVKQLEEAIAEEKRLIGSGKRKEQAVISYRELKKKFGRRPTYMELHQHANVDSQEYRQLFDSYYTFLLQAGQLDKEEAAIAKRYTSWLKEVENTIIRKSYKMVLLQAMLGRGAHDWMKSITAEEVAPCFYQYYMNDEIRKSVDFSDNETQKLWDAPLERTAQLIARMPMTHWAKAANKLLQYADGTFQIKFPIRETDEQLLYKWTREICEYRLYLYFERKATAVSTDTQS
ncbi:DUF4145 domain-containing protein [Brevibacillus porteri]|uniref:DUF8090 domain-containing protein n=1 Tax=Brevibacillus porteri TaxID=2126350 RepID=A0ABX5FVA0_9BACL|nr:DUF4145 domain-containing protein [Brevibacillus porteri]MED1797378.1 DUF4145 domain-containing protein [Brevibacillus porteri]MED2129448.1 DUF4145 domain-containing protein [Brevibacillus porteri]MED2747629.1 DUF4145 domain-containing protein [Brevibacillus porteri]MED2815644.1 DUF4145 domain-containing protein [Brevibacillus porteri]MED2896757.1 DUF4145 domain-containing protein [Brevibacillus porteri]